MRVLFAFLLCFMLLTPVFGNEELEKEQSVAASSVEPARFLGQVKPVLYVSDVRSAAKFYRDILGFEFLGFAGKKDAPYYAEMTAADQKFGLHEPQNERDTERVGKQRLYFRVSDVQAHRSWVIANGGEAGEIKIRDWMTMFTVRDADGHDIVFAETDPAVHKTNSW